MYNNAPEAGLASLLASRGRDGDSMLVHMAPEEVHGLHALALAHGGELTINPHTGLYEASFLKKLLPTIIGLALAPLTAGTSLAFLGNPLVAGALVGGVEGLRTGDLGKGLMAGLGAFGGAGLGAGLSAAAGAGGASAAGAGAAGTTGSVLAPQTAAQLMGATGTEAAKQGFMSTMGQGVMNLGKEAGRKAFMEAIPGGALGAGAAATGIGNALTPDFELPNDPYQMDDSYYESYGYDPSQGRFLGGKWAQGYPGFPPTGMADGGEVQAPSYSGSLADYMSQLNQFVTSPIAPPPQTSPPPAAVAPTGAGGNVVAGSGGFPGGYFNPFGAGGFDLDALQNYISNIQGSGDGGMTWDPTQGRFISSTTLPSTQTQPSVGSGTAATPPYDFSGIDLSGIGSVYAGGSPTFNENVGEVSQVDMSGINPFMEGYNPVGGVSAPQMSVTPEAGDIMYAGGSPTFNENIVYADKMPAYEPPPVAQYQPPAMPAYEPPPVAQYQPTQMAEPVMPDFSSYANPFTGPATPDFDSYANPYAEYNFSNQDYGDYMFAGGGGVEYAAAGKFLRGPGDGMSDSIKANISGKQEARLADGEFVIPADVVSHIGNGSSEAGADRLHMMMDRIRKARTGKTRQAPEIDADKYLPA